MTSKNSEVGLVKRDVSRNVELPFQDPVPQMTGPDQPDQAQPQTPSEHLPFFIQHILLHS